MAKLQSTMDSGIPEVAKFELGRSASHHAPVTRHYAWPPVVQRPGLCCDWWVQGDWTCNRRAARGAG
jgi:hypothetical protein